VKGWEGYRGVGVGGVGYARRGGTMLSLLFWRAAGAATLTVGPNSTYATVGAAVSAAAPGDVVQIEAGTYAEELVVADDLTLRGAGAATVLQGTTDWALEVDHAHVTVEDLTVQGDDGCIYVDHGHLTVTRAEIRECTASSGAGVNLWGSDAEIRDSAFADNTATSSAANLYVNSGGTVLVERVSFSRAGGSSSISTPIGQASLTILDATFVDDGSGIFAQGDIRIERSTFEGGSSHLTAYNADPADISTRTSLVVLDSTFRGATSGAVFLGETDAVFERCVFEDNADVNGAGAIESETYEPLALRQCAFARNTGVVGAVTIYASATEITECTFEDNVATSVGGAVYFGVAGSQSTIRDSVFARNVADYRGGAVHWSSDDLLSISGSVFTDNTARYGGALYFGTGDLTLVGNRMCGNVAEEGGAAEVNSFEGVYTNNVLIDNVASQIGGAMLIDGPSEVVNNTFLGNRAPDGAAVSLGYAGITWVNNLVAGSGEALAVDGDAPAAGYDAYWDNAYGDTAWPATTDVLDDPHVSWVPGACDLPTLGWPRPLVDAGDPSLSDPDGSRSDIGHWGGPAADAVLHQDGDGDGASAMADCDDDDPAVLPGATEVWYDGVDQDCDGNDDDQDVDGAPVGLDCDDLDPAVHPGATEVWYDGVDQDCDGNDDDQDVDGVPVGVDCDDVDAGVHPGAAEVWYDGVDQDCDGNDDDQDVDGVPVDVDCDDLDPTVFPGAVEIPQDGIDQDCDGLDGGTDTGTGTTPTDTGTDTAPTDTTTDTTSTDTASTNTTSSPGTDPGPDAVGKPSEGCGCGSGGPLGTGWFAVALGCLASRRRVTGRQPVR
jgi:hypothetical protein